MFDRLTVVATASQRTRGGRLSGRSRHVPWLIAIATIGAWAVFSLSTESGPGWKCTPIDPAERQLTDKPCFRALLSEENKITLQWRVINSQAQVYIYDDYGPSYKDIGFQPAVCNSGGDGACSLSFRVNRGGILRWQLEVTRWRNIDKRGYQQLTHVPATITVPPPFQPAEVSGGGFVDILAPTSRTFSWVVDPRNDWTRQNVDVAWVELNSHRSILWSATHYPRSGPEASFTVQKELLNTAGDVVYGIRDCHLPADSDTKICSEPAYVHFRIGSDSFLGHSVIHTRSGEDLEIHFTGKSGNVRMLSSPSLIPAQGGLPFLATSGTSHIIDAALLSPGLHRLELSSCLLQQRICSNRTDVDAAGFDGTLFQLPPGDYSEGDLIGVLVSGDWSTMQAIRSPAIGRVQFERPGASHRIQTDEAIAHVITAPGDVLDIQVDSPVQWELDREYTMDFHPAVAHPIIGAGQPLDITYDGTGGIWLINEFSSSIEHVSSAGKTESYTVPLARRNNTQNATREAVKPFTLLLGDMNEGVASSMSMLAERATRVESTLWFTQGGGLIGDDGITKPNHSRIISFDPSLSDSLQTPYDDRLCVYNIPADDDSRLVNNQVIGLTASRGRIWIAESRRILGRMPSVISCFIPNPENCENLLDYSDPEALASQDLQYCGPYKTPEQDACIEKFSLGALPIVIKVAHLETDPTDGSVWFTDSHGKYLGNLDPQRPDRFRVHPLPDVHSSPRENMPLFGGFPWALKADEDAVYLGEYATQHILRFDKVSNSFDEILIPVRASTVRLHSLDIDASTDRLWFSLANEAHLPVDRSSSTIGYIDLASWREHRANPTDGKRIYAVLYRGLNNIGSTVEKAGQHHAFRGIAVDPGGGNIALADMWRRQAVELAPNPGFWP